MMGGPLNTGNSKGSSTLSLPPATLPGEHHQVLSGTVSYVNNLILASLKQTQNSNGSVGSSFTNDSSKHQDNRDRGDDLVRITFDFWRKWTYGWGPCWLYM